jgi:type II secretory pathway pseudopilin PulG
MLIAGYIMKYRPPKLLSLKNSAGDTIVEVLISLAVLGFVLGSLAVLAHHSTQNLQTSQEHSSAARAGQTQLEYFRNYIDLHGDQLASAAGTLGSGFCMTNTVGATWSPQPATSGGNPAPYCVLNGSGRPAGLGEVPYVVVGKISKSSPNYNGYTVTFKVTWDKLGGGTNSSTLTYRIYKALQISAASSLSGGSPAPVTPPPPAACSKPARIVLLVDQSGSMRFPFDSTLRIDAARQAVIDFIKIADMAPGKDQVAIIAYSGLPTPTTYIGMTSDKTAALAAANNIDSPPAVSGSGTNAGFAITAGYDMLKDPKYNGTARIMILLGDGAQSNGTWPGLVVYTNKDAVGPADKADAAGMVISTVQIADDGAGTAFLKNIIPRGGGFYSPGTTETELSNSYKFLANYYKCV